LGNGTGEYIAGEPASTHEDYAVGKADFVASDRLRLDARYTFDTAAVNTLNPLGSWDYNNPSHYNLVQTSAQYMQSPSMIHDFRAAFSQIYNGATAAAPASDASLAFVPGASMGAIQVVGLSDFGGTLGRSPAFQHRRHAALLVG